MIFKPIFGAIVGAVGALALDRWIERRKERYRPSAVTGRFFESLNQRLEQQKARDASAPGRGGAE